MVHRRYRLSGIDSQKTSGHSKFGWKWIRSAAGFGFAFILLGGEALIAGLILPLLFYFGVF